MAMRKFLPRWGRGSPTVYLIVLALVPSVGTGFIAFTEDAVTAISTGLGAFMVGGSFGFLFGIPRYAASTSEQTAQDAAVVKYRANTNLEQISDWLTKILVGLGLTQFNAVGRFLAGVVETIGTALHGSASSSNGTVVAAGLLLLTSIPGFLFFYLWSRVYLPKMFGEAEKEG